MPKQLVIKRVVLTLLYAVFFIVLPTIIIDQHYHVFTAPETTEPNNPVVRVTAGLVIVTLLVYFFLRDIIKRAFNSLEPGNVKKILKTTWASLPLVLVNIVIAVTKTAIDDFQSCFAYLTASFVISNFICAYLDDIEQVCSEIKLLKRQDKYRKEYNL